MLVKLKYRNFEKEGKKFVFSPVSIHFLTSMFFWTTIKADIHPIIVLEIIIL